MTIEYIAVDDDGSALSVDISSEGTKVGVSPPGYSKLKECK